MYLTSGIWATGSGSNDVYAGTTFDDSSNPSGQVPYATNSGLATDYPYANGVVAFALAPSEGLAAFIGEDPNGTWTLTVADRVSSDGGTLRGWGLTVGTARCGPLETTIDSGPEAGSTTASRDAALTYSGAPAADVASFACSLDGAAFASCPADGSSVAGLADGTHTFRVAAVDVADNADPTPAERTWTVTGGTLPTIICGGKPATIVGTQGPKRSPAPAAWTSSPPEAERTGCAV